MMIISHLLLLDRAKFTIYPKGEILTHNQILGISEVWFWQDGVFSLYRLRAGKYDRMTHSEIPELTSLDIDLLTRCVSMAETSRLNAANEFRKMIKL